METSIMDVSIIIPYNEDRGYLAAAKQSAEAQEFKGSFEVILSHSPGSLGTNSNQGLKSAKGTYIKFLSEDDLLPRDSIQLLFDHLTLTQADWAFANAINIVDGIETLIKSSEAKLLKGNVIHGGSTMYKTQVLIAAGAYDETLWTAEEHELHLRLLMNKATHSYLDKTTYIYNQHPKSKSVQYRKSNNRTMRNKRKLEIQRIKNIYLNTLK